MKRKHVVDMVVGLICFFGFVSATHAQPGANTLTKATNVLNEFITMPNQGIPRSMLQKAQGIVIVPDMIKLGFVVGGRRGKGVVVIRGEDGAWRPPAFITMTGGSIGFQAGVQSTDVILVFNTRKSVNNLMNGKFTIGVDAAAAAGPVGRQAAAATDGKLQAEIFSYSRSRGLFAGASVDGSVIQIEAAETQNFYRAAGMTPEGTPIAPNAQMPLAAAQLLATLGANTGAPVAAPAANPPGTAPALPGTTTPMGPTAGIVAGNALSAAGVAPNNGVVQPAQPSVSGGVSAANAAPARPVDITRQELAKSAMSLGTLLDESWRNYLALPPQIFSGQGVPDKATLHQSLKRFDAVAADSKYGALLQRKEFQQTHGLLRTYIEQLEASTATIAPPASNPIPGNVTGPQPPIR